MINQLFAILYYYRTFALWSFVFTIFILFFGSSNIILALSTKLFLVGLIYYVVIETGANQKLTFYKNLGISDFKLFSIMYLIDALITLVFFILISQFL